MLEKVRLQEYNTVWIRKSRRDNPQYYARIRKANHERTKARIFLLYGNECTRCGFSDPRALQLDHKTRLAGAVSTHLHLHAQELCRAILNGKENWLNYQLLCANCNWIKRHENNERGISHGVSSDG